jgi:hypothetical protein
MPLTGFTSSSSATKLPTNNISVVILCFGSKEELHGNLFFAPEKNALKNNLKDDTVNKNELTAQTHRRKDIP